MSASLKIVDGTNHLDEVKRLILEYAKFLGRDLSFQHVDGKIIGCVAYHRHTAERCEMKRLFVREGYREHRAGSKLVEAIINLARADGFAEMVLDTIKPLESAIHLYKKCGFVECKPYYHNPFADVIYMKKNLSEE